MTKAYVELPGAYEELYTPSRYKAWYGGRGSAKSHTFSAVLIQRALEKPIRILCCREVQRSIRDSVKRLLDDKIRDLGLRALFKSTDTEIRVANGSLFVFAGLRTNPESVQSMEGIDYAWVEQAETVSKRSLEILIPTIRKPDSEIWFSWNPRHENDPVDQLMRQDPPDNAIVRHVTYKDNPFFPEVLRLEMEWDFKRDHDKYKHIWEGEYLQASGARVFNNWTIDSFDIPDDVIFRQGADWGFAVDPTVAIRCFIVDKTLYVCDEAYQVGCEIDDTPALFDQITDFRRWSTVADSARPETISYMQRHGFNMKAAKKGAGSVDEGIEFLKSYDIVVHPKCKRTIDELHYYSYKVDDHTGDILPILQDKNNHVIDALRYANEPLMRVRRWGAV